MKYILIFSILFSTFACAQQPKEESVAKVEPKVEQKPANTNKTKGEVQWMTINEALEAQKKEPKKIFIDFYTNWCGPCKLLDKKTFHNADVAAYLNENFYPVKFNAEGNEVVNYKGQELTNPNYKETSGRGYPHQMSMAFKVNAYPTMVFLDEEGNYIFPLKGYLTPSQIEPSLKVIGSNDYKNIKSQEEFKNWMDNTFQPTFKE